MLKILEYPHPILKAKAKKIITFDSALKKLASEMIETMIAARGIGLAAPQVGKSIRLIIVKIDEKAWTFCNPEIIWTEGSIVMEEGCLSFPGKFIKVERPEKVKIKYQDTRGGVTALEADGLFARCLSHELDHLSGELFIDKELDIIQVPSLETANERHERSKN